jgi:hypothetical protein
MKDIVDRLIANSAKVRGTMALRREAAAEIVRLRNRIQELESESDVRTIPWLDENGDDT